MVNHISGFGAAEHLQARFALNKASLIKGGGDMRIGKREQDRDNRDHEKKLHEGKPPAQFEKTHGGVMVQSQKNCKVKMKVKKRWKFTGKPSKTGNMPTQITRQHKKKGVTLVEMVIVLVILSILTGIAIPEVMRGITTTKAANCGVAIRAIEAAKDRWKAEFPGAPPTEANLQRYFPTGQFPKDPWGIGFENVTNLSVTTTHIYNNIARFEPQENCGPENGYNDAFQPKN